MALRRSILSRGLTEAPWRPPKALMGSRPEFFCVAVIETRREKVLWPRDPELVQARESAPRRQEQSKWL